MPIIKQDNKEFFDMNNGFQIVYYVMRINGLPTTGREGSYRYLKCPECGRIVGTQFNGYGRHLQTHKNKV